MRPAKRIAWLSPCWAAPRSCRMDAAKPCHANLCHAALWQAMPCIIAPQAATCHAMPCHAMPCHAMPCCLVASHAMPCAMSCLMYGHCTAPPFHISGPEVQRFNPGDRVMSPFTANCGDCFYCRRGLTARSEYCCTCYCSACCCSTCCCSTCCCSACYWCTCCCPCCHGRAILV